MNEKALNHSLEFIKSWLTFRYKREDIPGYVVAVSYKGKIVLNEAYGYADLEKKTKLRTDHIFRIASHSKTFTATALMQLQEQGKLRIDDYIVDYLPWLKKHTDKRWQKVTIRQLMSHGAGVIRDGEDSDYWQLLRPFPSEDELKKDVLETKLVFDNNVKMKYSNYGYSLLGMIIEYVTGQSYNDYVTEHIVNKLKLAHTGPEYVQSIESKIVTGYSRNDVDKKRVPIANIDTRSMSAATGFYSTANDLCTYFNAQFAGTEKLLSDESKKEMQRMQWHAKIPEYEGHEDYGLGFELDTLDRRNVFGHGGGFPGHITKTMADPSNGLVVVVLTNCLNSPATLIAKAIYKIIDYYQDNTPITKPKHDLLNLEGTYMNLWSTASIIVTGDKIIATYPDTWYILSSYEELEYIDANTLKVVGTESFNAEGELIKFSLTDNKVDRIVYNGATMWTEEDWTNKQRKRKVVTL